MVHVHRSRQIRSNLVGVMLPFSRGLLLLSLALGCGALRLPPQLATRRSTIASLAYLSAPWPASARFTEEAKSLARDVTGLNMEAPAEKAAPPAAPPTPAELRLQELLKKTVAEKEAALGFKFDASDTKDLETILRNKYCGKSGLFSSMPGGACEDNVIAAAYCSSDGRFSSSSAACDEELGLKRTPGIGNIFK